MAWDEHGSSDVIYFTSPIKYCAKPASSISTYFTSKGSTIQSPEGGGGSVVLNKSEINKFEQTLCEVNNLPQKLFHINML